MGVTVHIPTPLRALTEGKGSLAVEASSVQELLVAMDRAYPGLRARLCEEDGTVRRFINLYVNEEDVRFLRGLETPLKDGDEVTIVPAMAGGR
jgi:molybdopterin synthase sulfur carrier subunit